MDKSDPSVTETDRGATMPDGCPRPHYLLKYQRCHDCPRWDRCQTEGWSGTMEEYYDSAGPTWNLRRQTTDQGKTWYWYVYAVNSKGIPFFCPAYFLKLEDAQAWVDSHEIQLEMNYE